MQLGIPTLIQAARRTHICQKRADVGHRTGMDFPPFAKSGRKGGAPARFDFLRDLIDYQCVRGMERRGGWSAMLAFAALTLPLAFSPPSVPVSEEQQNGRIVAAPETSPATSLPSAAAERRIVVSIPDRKLAVVERGRAKKIYRVGVGAKDTPSPAGKFHIVNKAAKPNYYRKGEVVAAGESNPVGSRWLGLDLPHYGIHGTNEPQSIGQEASHGCIRLAKPDVEELYDMARVGDEVEIAEKPLAEMAILGL